MVIKSTVQPNLPDDIEALKRLLLGKERQIKTLQARLEQLEEAMRQLLSRQCGPSSEKDPTPQMRLFNEPECFITLFHLGAVGWTAGSSGRAFSLQSLAGRYGSA